MHWSVVTVDGRCTNIFFCSPLNVCCDMGIWLSYCVCFRLGFHPSVLCESKAFIYFLLKQDYISSNRCSLTYTFFESYYFIEQYCVYPSFIIRI